MDWTEDEEGVMGLILASDPEVLPCDLAVILRKPCNEVRDKMHCYRRVVY